jgi:ribose 5-phosphate isomerase B
MLQNKKYIAIGSDHAGLDLKNKVIHYLNEKGYEVKDFGTFNSESVDYTDFAHSVARAVGTEQHDRGILICGSGVGVSITANRHSHIRCALCWNAEIARLSRQHNDANILAMAGRFLSEQESHEIVDAFLNTDFEGGRHLTRIGKMNC